MCHLQKRGSGCTFTNLLHGRSTLGNMSSTQISTLHKAQSGDTCLLPSWTVLGITDYRVRRDATITSIPSRTVPRWMLFVERSFSSRCRSTLSLSRTATPGRHIGRALHSLDSVATGILFGRILFMAEMSLPGGKARGELRPERRVPHDNERSAVVLVGRRDTSRQGIWPTQDQVLRPARSSGHVTLTIGRG